MYLTNKKSEKVTNHLFKHLPISEKQIIHTTKGKFIVDSAFIKTGKLKSNTSRKMKKINTFSKHAPFYISKRKPLYIYKHKPFPENVFKESSVVIEKEHTHGDLESSFNRFCERYDKALRDLVDL